MSGRSVWIALPLADAWRGGFTACMRAELVGEIAPHLAGVLTPALHRAPWPPYGWAVSDVETGRTLRGAGPLAHTDPEAALWFACELLAQFTAAEVAALLTRGPDWVRG